MFLTFKDFKPINAKFLVLAKMVNFYKENELDRDTFVIQFFLSTGSKSFETYWTFANKLDRDTVFKHVVNKLGIYSNPPINKETFFSRLGKCCQEL